MLGRDRVSSLRRAALDRETEVLHQEVDIDDDVLVHRLLFAPREEVTLDLRELELKVAARQDRRVYLGGAFVEHAADDDEA